MREETKPKSDYAAASARLTSHRLVFAAEQTGARALRLDEVTAVTKVGGWMSSMKARADEGVPKIHFSFCSSVLIVSDSQRAISKARGLFARLAEVVVKTKRWEDLQGFRLPRSCLAPPESKFTTLNAI